MVSEFDHKVFTHHKNGAIRCKGAQMTRISTNRDAVTYLDSLFALSRRGFSTLQAAREAILQIVTEQLTTRSSFFSVICQESGKFEVIAAHNESGNCNVEVGTVAHLSPQFPVMISSEDGPAPLVRENLHSDPTTATLSALAALPSTGCYIGVPIVLSDGTLFGALSTVDPEPRQMSLTQAKLLVVLARLLATQVEREQELTGRKWAEVELSRALRALQMANEQREYLKRVQSDFVSIVNHEFRTTLTAIQGFSELMREEELSIQDVKEYAYDINVDARRLSRMINQLLDLDQMKSGQVPLHLEQVDLNEIIVAVVQRIRPTAPGHQIHLQLAEHFPLLAGDYDRLSLVVTNLLNNAIKYSPAGGEIRLGSCVEDASVRVFVQDCGVGIPAHALNQVFEMHTWAYESNGPRYIKGTGLGLPIVRQIVQMHNGKIWAESVQDKGSIFHFTLPISNEEIQ
jgi:signal transduction histidine kinase